MSLLEVRDVRVEFGGIRAVDGISLDVERGSFLGVVGPNGSGKTTLLNAISGVYPLTSGSIKFDGQELRHMRPHEVSRIGVGRTFQSTRIIPELSVWENIMAGADRVSPCANVSRRIASGLRKGVCDELIERLRLTAVRAKTAASLPYGTQRRVEIARSLANRPELLLLDEPAAGMSQSEKAETAELMVELREQGLTQVLVEHDLRMVMTVCDQLFVMDYGKCLASGEPSATAARPEVVEAYLGRSGTNS